MNRHQIMGKSYVAYGPPSVRNGTQRSQTLAQITTQLNDGANCTVSKRTAQLSLHCMGFGSLRSTRVPLLDGRHRAARLSCAREHMDWRVEDWKRVAWSDES
ncbi:HTH_Tnp_Tc3_2 domain-containing protein [Trichonephila clavipes]|nr:HTH_Tnp_Tc3_2 domain-containing protein [Trichonephila clavipes]